jgi:hypothetical protein
MDLPFELAPGVEVALDVSPASWVDDRLLPTGRSAGVRVGGVIPTGFEAYARIFHPAHQEPSFEPITWSEIARRTGTVVHPEMQLEYIVGVADIHAAGFSEPDEGRCPPFIVEALVEILVASTPGDGCWFAIWDGYGSLGPGLAVIRSFGDDRTAARAHERAERARRRRAAEQLAAIPRFSIHPSPAGAALRDYILLHGPIEVASRLEFNGSYQSPNLWWPDDRSWCVATEVDGFSTYVGGSRLCIDAVLADARLEALPSDPQHRFDGDSDRVNPRPPGLYGR